jgi:hypothetical protein
MNLQGRAVFFSPAEDGVRLPTKTSVRNEEVSKMAVGVGVRVGVNGP